MLIYEFKDKAGKILVLPKPKFDELCETITNINIPLKQINEELMDTGSYHLVRVYNTNE